jgi:3'-phosphoadenosine 5'-phosphosulfate sulfotransferase (PAPS reductase)/FAD synthetase
MKQLELFPSTELEIDWKNIDSCIVFFSGGKDSLACLLWAMENIDRHKIEVWHHLVDGRGENLFDWGCTESYVRAVTTAFALPLYLSWCEGGFLRELLRDNQPHARTWFETPDGLKYAGGNGKPNTRRRFPAKSQSLQTRWCSSALKIDVAKIAIANQSRFNGKKIVAITGERREESPARSKYAQSQYYVQPNHKRIVYQYRPVLDWSEREIWAKIADYRIAPHPAYTMGFGRVSCQFCIFSSPSQLATNRAYYPDRFKKIAELERELNHTIDSKLPIDRLADGGRPYQIDRRLLELAANEWTGNIFID